MIAQTRSEILKIRSTRTTLGLVIGMLVIVIAFTVLSGLLSHARELQTPEDQRNLLGIGSVAGIFAALAGILVVTSEFRFGTIRPTFLVSPSWPRILGAKVVASTIAGLVFGIVGLAVSYAIGYVCLSSRNIPFVLDNGDVAWLLAGIIIGSGIWGGIGVGLGTVVRNQIGAVIALLAWGFVVENLLIHLVPGVGRFGPLQAQNAFQGSDEAHLLAPLAGAAIMLVWLAGLGAIGLVLTSRRDVA